MSLSKRIAQIDDDLRDHDKNCRTCYRGYACKWRRDALRERGELVTAHKLAVAAQSATKGK